MGGGGGGGEGRERGGREEKRGGGGEAMRAAHMEGLRVLLVSGLEAPEEARKDGKMEGEERERRGRRWTRRTIDVTDWRRE